MGNRAVSFDSATYLAEHSSKHSNSSRLDMKKFNSPGSSVLRRKRGFSTDSIDRDDYGWFEDFEPSDGVQRTLSFEFSRQPLQKALSLPPPVTEPPLYVLESSLETQQLWYSTAGRRPKQPQQEREYYENLWRKNFENSSVKYKHDTTSLASSSSASAGGSNAPDASLSGHARSVSTDSPTPAPKRSKFQQGDDIIPPSEIKGEVLYRGKSPFSNSVSKSFLDEYVASMTLHMPYYRICRGLSGEIYAEYLIKVTIGGNAPLTFGIWKRHSDFRAFADIINTINIRSGSDNNVFKNALLSWQCVLQRKRWFRSLDKDYLALKCFLLERFMHDVLFEAQSPAIINKFLGLS